MKHPAFLRAEVLRRAWRRAGWPEVGMTGARWGRLARLVRRQRPGRFDIGSGVVAVTGAGVFTLRRAAPDTHVDHPSPFA
jgi:tRNA(Ile)-lysidine synthase